MEALISKRLLRSKKDRVAVHTMIDRDLLQAINEHKLRLADVVNIALARWLEEKGFLKEEKSEEVSC